MEAHPHSQPPVSLPAGTPVWLKELLHNREVTDLCFNGPYELFFDQGFGLEHCTSSFSKQPSHPHFLSVEAFHQWVLSLLASAGKSWDAKFPFMDAILLSGHRLHVVFPPLARQGILLSFRRLPLALAKTQLTRWKDSFLYDYLTKKVLKGDSVLISGATGSGKTTLLSDLIQEVPLSERIIALEDTAELAPAHPHFISLVSRLANADGFGEVTLRMLLKQTLRMRPDRIMLGECRGPEILELLQALNTGHRGAMATLHANSAREALKRIELLCLLASAGAVPLFAVRELISLGVQYVAQVKKTEKHRFISEVWKIEGREGDSILMRKVIDSEAS